MRSLAILLCREADLGETQPGLTSLFALQELLGFSHFPAEDVLFLFVAIEMERHQAGTPVNARVEMLNVDRADGPVVVSKATGIVQMPIHEQMPPVFTMCHQLKWTFPEAGVYEISLYLDDEPAANRRVACFETASIKTRGFPIVR